MAGTCASPKPSRRSDRSCSASSRTSIIGDGKDIKIPRALDLNETWVWEVESAVIIGETARNVSEDEALEHVSGDTVAN